jgi:hypothetical protein
MSNSPDKIPYINPRASRHLRVRLVPEIRWAIESEAQALKTSMTNVTLSAISLYFRQRYPKDEAGNWLYW